jgi:hypothetical protein
VDKPKISVLHGANKDCTARVCNIANADLRLASTNGAGLKMETSASVMQPYFSQLG